MPPRGSPGSDGDGSVPRTQALHAILGAPGDTTERTLIQISSGDATERMLILIYGMLGGATERTLIPISLRGYGMCMTSSAGRHLSGGALLILTLHLPRPLKGAEAGRLPHVGARDAFRTQTGRPRRAARSCRKPVGAWGTTC